MQILFPLALLWGSVLVFAHEIQSVFGLIPVPEGQWSHDAVEVVVVLVIFIAFAAGAMFCFRRWPWFLRVPEPISLVWLTVRLLGYVPLVFAVLAGAFFSTWWLFVVPGEDPGHSQYGLSAWFAAFFYSIVLTPVFTVVLVWLSALRRHRKRTG